MLLLGLFSFRQAYKLCHYKEALCGYMCHSISQFFRNCQKSLFCKFCHIYVNTVKYSRTFSQGNTYVCMVMQRDLVDSNVHTQYSQIPINCCMSTCVHLYGMYAEEIRIKQTYTNVYM